MKAVEKIKTQFVFNNFFSSKIAFFNEIMQKYIVELGKPQMKIHRMHITC